MRPFRSSPVLLASLLVATALAGMGGHVLAQGRGFESAPLLPPAGVGQPDYPGYPSNNRAPPPPQQRSQQPPPPQQQPYQGIYGYGQGSQNGQVLSQPLPPPPGSQAQPSAPPAGTYQGIYGQQAPAQPPAQGRAPAQPAPPAAAQGQAAQPPADADVLVVPPPTEKIVNPTAVYAGLDKITGRITSFEVGMGETVQFGALQVTPRACYTRPPTEATNTTSFAEVNEITLKGEAKRIFTGWMFAASPGLHGVEHPIYDVWLTDCKAAAPVTAKPGGQQ
ncbi:DUF2155 domain-containing protein [Xanthobacteraceae bacterium A53D]